MKKFVALLCAIDQGNDALAQHRHAIVKSLSLVGGVMWLGVVGIQLVSAEWWLATLNFAVAATLLFISWWMRDGADSPLPMPAVAIALVIGVLLSVHLQGVVGVFRSFPLVFVCYFALSRRMATALAVVLVLGVTALAWPRLGPEVALRALLSLVFVVLMVNIVLNLVGELQKSLLSQAITDPLTGAYNRRHLQTHLDSLGQPAQAGPGAGNALLALDIDHFKDINDRHGHDAGDEVLRRLVMALNARKRINDLLFRTGGEEFMLLLPRVGEAAALQVAEDLRERIAASPLLPDQTVTVSIGVSVLAPGQDARSWLKRADTALYAAKRAGRNRVVAAAA